MTKKTSAPSSTTQRLLDILAGVENLAPLTDTGTEEWIKVIELVRPHVAGIILRSAWVSASEDPTAEVIERVDAATVSTEYRETLQGDDLTFDVMNNRAEAAYTVGLLVGLALADVLNAAPSLVPVRTKGGAR